MLGAFVPEHDRENVVVDELFDALGDAAKELVAVEDGGELAADVVEKREGIGLLRMGIEERLGDGIGVPVKREGGDFGEFVQEPGSLKFHSTFDAGRYKKGTEAGRQGGREAGR
jgi:hypothetical protein